MTTYRTTIKGATSYNDHGGWYFGYTAETLYEGNDKTTAIAAYDGIDMATKAKEYGTAVEREVVELNEEGDVIGTAMRNAQAMGSDLHDIYDGTEGWWMILSKRHNQVSPNDQRLYRIDLYKGAYYVAAYQADSGFARQVIAVHGNEADMAAEVERRGITEYLTNDDLKIIGLELNNV